MNANELADELLAVVNVSSHVKMCASDMLRRQQAEIERLTTKNLEWLANWNEQQAEIAELKAMLGHYEDVYEGVVTHPAGLTDEEITAIWQTDECYQNAQAFARAILRKAQDK